MTAFSFVFDQPGVYVFQDSVVTTKISIMGVVGENQDCSSKDTNVQSATAQSLAAIGISTQSKNVNTQWAFIIGTFVFLLLISFGFVGLVVFLHNKNDAQNSLANNGRKSQIYYDRVSLLEEHDLSHSRCQRFMRWLLCRKVPIGVAQPEVPKAESGELSYDDLQRLLREFREQMELLRAKLREEEGRNLEEEEEDDEEALVRELADLREFVNNNKECIEEFFHIKRGGDEDDIHHQDEYESAHDKETPGQVEVRELLLEQH